MPRDCYNTYLKTEHDVYLGYDALKTFSRLLNMNSQLLRINMFKANINYKYIYLYIIE